MTFLILLIACAAAGATGILFQPGAWYDGLAKPWFNPPRWAFPVAWTTLYVLIAWAGARLAHLPGAGLVMALWAAQIALNTLWTPVFFGAHRMGMGVAVIALLWLVVAALTVLAFRLDRLAGALLLPYLAWLSLAGALNYRLWQMNPGAGA
ncbi:MULTISPECIES: tryptophan-rich sensory protein TspO [Paracoccus]|jgi:tryptophan-rich sensory protein|uniref:Tryptophan-rich sensory protein n=2 Tax=Paracoccus TaxID=265 RepID=A0A2D2BYX5_9RHOB|nr:MULTISPECIES: TspO/MBR family protein [Paracoccus]PZO68389.1 MAG: tryptophan-rich sensory protein [Kocuria palustris]ATQ55452.1 tryptophan-rich sensory protein [Paracoccus yeei]AWX93317.1 tryptophan-rich sensory protein [Paracoccus mutanolyticus]AYF02975.1 tryptophan-rich sensory protein [Paracoccus yeei]OWJ94754.1 tryptophan-rich sensory protein [Paracoccus yeei]